MKPTAPGSSFSYICLAIYFFLAFIFRSIKPKKYKNTLLQFILIYLIWHSIYQSITTFSRLRTVSGAVTRKGLTTPLTRRVASGCCLCAGAVYVVLLGSPTGSITLVSFLREYLLPLCRINPSSLGKYRHSFKRHHSRMLIELPVTFVSW